MSGPSKEIQLDGHGLDAAEALLNGLPRSRDDEHRFVSTYAADLIRVARLVEAWGAAGLKMANGRTVDEREDGYIEREHAANAVWEIAHKLNQGRRRG